MKDETYYSDYDNEPIGGSNSYYRCVYCKVSDPEINGRLEGHREWCEYRLRKEKELKISETEGINIKDILFVLNDIKKEVIPGWDLEFGQIIPDMTDEEQIEYFTKCLDKAIEIISQINTN